MWSAESCCSVGLYKNPTIAFNNAAIINAEHPNVDKLTVVHGYNYGNVIANALSLLRTGNEGYIKRVYASVEESKITFHPCL